MVTPGPRRSTDVLVVGGGPAGLAAAIASRLTGLDVTLVERHRPPVDKACGEGIMPDGARILARLGVSLPEGSYLPFRGIHYIEGRTRAVGRFALGPGIGVRRTVLHEALARRAEAIGVRLCWETTFGGLVDSGALIDGQALPARFVVAADGANSRVRRDLGFDLPPRHRRVGIRRHFEVAPWSDCVEVHWTDGCEIYVTPVAHNQVCVAALTSEPELRLDRALSRFPALEARLAQAATTSRELGSATCFRSSRAVVRGNVALLGDAAGSVDAITGAGVTLALHQSIALARAVASGDLGPYARAHAKIQRLPNRMTSMMLAIHRNPRMRRCTLAALAAAPRLFAELLALHTRARTYMRHDLLLPEASRG